MVSTIVIAIIIVVIVIVVLSVALGIALSKADFGTIFESGKKRAGRQGEQFAAQLIRGILNEKDVLLNNVSISFGDKPAELDNVIIKKRHISIPHFYCMEYSEGNKKMRICLS